MSGIRTIDIKIGTITNAGVECKNPTVELAGRQDVAISCIDPTCGLYRVQLGPEDDDPCLTFIVTCEECDVCPPQIIDVCLCDTIDDCPDCHICVDGVCKPLCPPEECIDGVCQECVDDEDCPCNQVCVNGKCECPVGSKDCDGDGIIPNANGCCDDCCNGDCPPCFVCVDKGGFKTCEPRECPDGVCDDGGGTGVPKCGELGACVECLNSGDCTGANECCSADCTCECCPGFKRVNGVCVQRDCEFDEDCDVCERCFNGVCVLQDCPPGRIPVNIGGVCRCVEECDCEKPDCSSRFDQCVDSAVPDKCGCIPCEGDCTNGCLDPCICDPAVDRCVFNPCIGSCTNGTDCPSRECGCLDGECVPCFLLDCTTTDCDQALGCECVGNNCVPDTCPPTACSVASDCPFGCTCFEGICTSCSNFSCVGPDCSQQEGCVCIGGECQGDEEDCTDTLTMDKDDENCELTGTLIKDNCCQCPALTLDSKGQTISETADSYTFNFIAELRKGAFNEISVDANPRLDNFDHPNIAENEPPTSGTISFIYEVTYNIYEVINGQEVFQGISTAAPVATQSTFPADGSTAQVNFNSIVLPKIGSRTTAGTTIQEVRSVELGFFLTNSLVFPNKCNYLGGTQFADYNILSNSAYQAFGTVALSNPRGATVTSSDCRDPFFKWTKSADAQFNENPFRKKYIPQSGNTLSYVDVLNIDTEPDLESCFYYLLDVDCTCKDPISDYIVFCNPEDLDFSLANCNKCLTINAFDTCEVNETVTFFVEFGDQKISWVGSDAPVGEQFCSGTEIRQVVFGIECDKLGVCTQVYEVPDIELDLNFTTECSPSNGEFTVTFDPVSADGSCAVDYITIGTFTLAGNLSKTLPFGSYTATVHWDCGCDPQEFDVIEDCCDFTLSACTRLCDGTIQGCLNDPGVTYSVAGSQITQSLRSYVENLSTGQSVQIVAAKGNCIPIVINIPDLDSFCCENFEIDIRQALPQVLITVVNGTGDVTVTVVDDDTGSALLVTDNGDGTYTVNNIVEGQSYTVTATDSVCGTETGVFVGGECELIVDLQEYEEGVNCRLRAVVDPQTCECRDLIYSMDITSVVDKGDDFDVYFTTELDGNDANPIAGELFVGTPDNLIGQGIIEGSGSVTIPKSTVNTSNCIPAILEIIATDPDSDGIYSIEIEPQQSNGNRLIDHPDVASITIRLDSTELTASNAVNAQSDPLYIFHDFSVPNSGSAIRFRLEIETLDTSGNLFKFVVATYSVTPFNQSTLAASICQQATANIDTKVKFQLKSLALEDNCSYFNAQMITTSQEYLISPSGTVTPANQSKSLTPNVRNARWVRFTWLRDGIRVFREFVGAPTYTSILPLTETIVGSFYDVEAACAPCSHSDSKFLCCLPEISTSIVGCNDQIDVTATGLQGSYVITYAGVGYGLTIDGTGSGSVSIPGPATETKGIVAVNGVPNCSEMFDIPLEEECAPIITYDCVDSDTFDAIITGCGTPTTIVITSGSGAVNGFVVEDIQSTNPAIVDITGSNGCITTGVILSFNCTVTSPHPTGTPSVTPSPGSTLTPSPTISVTPSVTGTPGATRTPSPSITISPTATPSPTPTISVSPTIGQSVTPTRSVTPTISDSRTPTPTRTPTVTPSNTRTPSVTPSNTPTRTPTRTPSRTPTRTATQTPTPTLTGPVTPPPSKTRTPTPTQTPPPSQSKSPTAAHPFCDAVGQQCGDCGVCEADAGTASGFRCVPVGGCNVCRECVGNKGLFSYNCQPKSGTEPDWLPCGSVCYDPTVNQCCTGGQT